MTDSGVLVGDFLIDGKPVEGAESMPTDGRVFRFDPASGEAWFLDRGLGFANGIAFGPDGALYANETLTGNVYRYRLDDEGRLSGERETFGNVNDPGYTEGGLRGPDGMAFSEDGTALGHCLRTGRRHGARGGWLGRPPDPDRGALADQRHLRPRRRDEDLRGRGRARLARVPRRRG